jgi:hypothetical protein
MTDRRATSFGVYDTKFGGLAYIGLHDDEADVWQIFLGWPDDAEIQDAKARGLCVLPLTVKYEPPPARADT